MMDVDDFDKSHGATSVDAGGERHPLHAVLEEKSRLSARARGGLSNARQAGTAASRPAVTWIRAADLLNLGAGRIAGRGIDLQANAVRQVRRAPVTAARAIRARAARLAPLSEFGAVRDRAQIGRDGFGRA
ncbi:hypothetical protein E3T35_07935 [Cryobacterium sp. TMT1-2-2]|uniref:hypothetical protein n=1 Tax=Cryobacterium sp. TMT1-2-2 TaxID=1259233 RepID=UPI00106BECEC|nr:hypothetical protein [Cryobacterium sp. TMT1-2-2]TFD12125.1 hypothetical protein E3T35_07935 [Cryobacterium sp. TMT1-2-2]